MTIKRKSLPGIVSPETQYIKEIQRYPVLTKEQEFELAVKYFKEKEVESAHQLVVANLRFVIKIANEYANYGLKLIDLIQEGNIGLMRAVKTFNPYRDTRLITYAVWWIRSYIHDYIQHNWSMVKIGTTQAQRKLFYRLKKEKEELRHLHLDDSPKLLAHKMGVREKDVVEMEQRMSARDVSLNAPLTDEDKKTHIDFVADEHNSVEQVLEEKESEIILKEKLESFEKTLKDRDLYIFQQRLLSENPITLQSIADKYNISKERARQLEERIKKNLKSFLSPE